MSNHINSELLERARYVQERYVGTYLVDAIDNLIRQSDLEKLEFMVRDAEYELGMEDMPTEGLSSDTY